MDSFPPPPGRGESLVLYTRALTRRTPIEDGDIDVTPPLSSLGGAPRFKYRLPHWEGTCQVTVLRIVDRQGHPTFDAISQYVKK